MYWRVVSNEWNLKAMPWRDAFGIEEDDEELAVPAIVCWFMRGTPIETVEETVRLHNETLKWRQQCR